MGKISFISCFIVLTSGLLQAQVSRYMVFFHDKVGTPYTISTPETFLSGRAITRRENQNISITTQDLPVDPAYVTGVSNTGALVLYKTKWMNGVLIQGTTADTTAIALLPFVDSIKHVAPGARPPAGGRIGSSKKFKEVAETSAVTDAQISILGMDDMHAAGYRGEGMLVAIMDAGFPGVDTISFFKHVFDEGRFDAATSYDFVSGGSNVFRKNGHGTNVWSTMAAFKEGVYRGGAYKANYILFITEHTQTEYRVEEYNWLFAAEKADSAGVDVISTSLGYTTFDDANTDVDYTPSELDGQTAIITRAAEIAASKGIAVVASAGNEGPGSTTIGAPADGKNVLAVGSVTSSETLSGFSSRGPSADGRIKPDVMAMGSSVAVISTNGNLATSNGTSFAAPLEAALVTGVWQMLPDLTAKELLDTIRSRANLADSPNNDFGYGISRFDYPVPVVETRFLTVRPNPTANTILLVFRENPQNNSLQVAVVDSKGVSTFPAVESISNREFSIDLSNFAQGIYLIQCQLGSHYSVHKIHKRDY